ncbi:MAG: oligosaccharide flippase family protein, partial [Thermomicrobiales bacterium]
MGFLVRRLAGLLDAATRGWAILTAGNVLRLAIGFVASVLIARSLGPTIFATFAVLGAIATIAGAVVDPGLTDAAVQRIAKVWAAEPVVASERARAFLWWRAATALGLGGLGWVVLIAVGAATGGLPTGDLLALALLGTVATALSGAIGAILQGIGRFGRLAAVGLTNAALTAVLAVILAALGRLTLVTALVVLGIGTSLAAFIVGCALLPRDWRLGVPGWAVLRAEGLALVRVGRWLWLAHSAALLAAQLDLLLVNHWRDAAETGMYALALNLAAKADIVNGGLYTVLLPAAAALAGPGAVRHYLRRGFVRSGLIALALLPTGLLIGWFIDTFYGTDYHPAARLYQLLLAVVIFDLLTTPLVLLAYHHQRPQLLAGADLLRVVVLLAVGAVLIPAAGPLGGVTGAVVARLVAKAAGVL